MKRMLISAACAIFIFGTACAREVTKSPTFILHGPTIVSARRAGQLNGAVGEGGIRCTAEYIPDCLLRRPQAPSLGALGPRRLRGREFDYEAVAPAVLVVKERLHSGHELRLAVIVHETCGGI